MSQLSLLEPYTEVEWCDCPDEYTSGHVCLLPVADVWVHGKCLKPSFAIWSRHEKYCNECGGSFSSPNSQVCGRCQASLGQMAGQPASVDPGASWGAMAADYRQYVNAMVEEYTRRTQSGDFPENVLEGVDA